MRRGRRADQSGFWASMFVLLAAVAAPAHAQRGEVRAFGLVIGTNLSSDPGVRPLRYADDDAVNNAKLLTELGAQVVLLVQLDRETRQIYPDIRETLPTKRAIDEGLAHLNQRMAQARALGHRAVLYLFYSGHGDVENNRGYVNLRDGRFWREDLMALLARSGASENHVIIDACKSFYLVFDRGAGGRRAPLSGSLLGEKSPGLGNTGVVLSTSSAADSHEWEAFQGGIFSHEIRSALRGAADLDENGKVTYEEAAAFVWAANASVPNPKYRPKVFVQAPGNRMASEAVLAQTRTSVADTLTVGPGVSAHLYLEDRVGRRLADLRPSPELRISLLLPKERPLFIRHGDADKEVELPPGHRLLLAALPTRATTVGRRGAEHVAFRSLFARSFGRQALIDYRHCSPEVVETIETRRDLTWVRRGAGILGLGAAILGGTMTGLAARESSTVTPRMIGTDRAEVSARIERYNVAAVVSYSIAAAGLATYFIWTLWPKRPVQIEVMPQQGMQIQVSAGF